MILQLAVIVLIGAFAFYQMKQGLFNALILAVCSFFSAILARTTYRWLGSVTNLYATLPLMAEPGCIGLVFFVSLILMRYLAEKFIPGNIIFSLIPDRIGGAIFGLFAGTIFGGILLVMLLLLPLSEHVLGYHQYNDDLTRDKTLAPLSPDDFIVSLGQLASGGSENQLMQGNNDILLEAFCARNTAGKGGGINIVRKDVFKAINLLLWKKPTLKIPQYPLLPKTDTTRVWVVRTEISNSVADPEDFWWRLPATQFKLVGKKQNGITCSFYPVGYLYLSGSNKTWTIRDNGKNIAKLIVTRPDPSRVTKKRRRRRKKQDDEKTEEVKLYIDWVFRIPANVTPKDIVFCNSVWGKLPKHGYWTIAGSVKLKDDALKAKPPQK
ncbi:MAG: CvpA family protein [Phycisphaerae bacterium]|nr:CvpA family protein [Phycisphaerae bacterium]